jgi:phospholipid/cholesterol/gamma-HCH transport system ATP-binding protein
MALNEQNLALRIRNASCEFSSHVLFQDLTLDLFRDQRWAIIGPSGEGKSVLLKIMAGLLEPTSGSVVSSARKGILFQKNALFDSMSVVENVAFPMREVLKLSEDEALRTAEGYLEAVGLGHAKALFPDEISGGMQKRLGIARAIAVKPELIFYDDPTAGLDPVTSRKIVDLICDLQSEQKSTFVAVTNDMNRVKQMNAKILFICRSQVIFCENFEQALQHSDPALNQFIHGLVSGPLVALA